MLLVLGNTVTGGYAATSRALAVNDQARLEEMEKVLFGQARPSLSTESRLRALEANLFGAHQQGTMSSRLKSISKAIGGGRTNLLLPPLAAQLDTSSKRRPASLAPSVSTPTASGGSAPYVSQDTSELNNDNVMSLLENAIKLNAAGRVNEAESSFKRVLELDHRNTDAHFSLGVMAEAKGDLHAALSHYKAAASINPSDSELKDAVSAVQNKLQGKIAAERARLAEAQRSYAETTQAQQRDQLRKIVSEASSAYKSGNFDRAIALLQTIAPQVPHDGDLQYALGQAYRGKGDLQESRTAFHRAVSIYPQNQLYRKALNEVEERIAHSANYTAGGVNNGFRSEHLKQYANEVPGGRTMPFSGSETAYQRGALDTPAGQIMPFSGSSITSWPLGRSDLRGGISMAGRPLSGTRLKRAAVGAMAGAAVGALTGSIGGHGVRGSVKNGAIRGGILGAVFGLMSGY